MIGWNHSATAVAMGLDHWVEQSALHRLLTPLGRRPWPPLPHGRLQVKPCASLFQPDLFQPLSDLLAVLQLAVVQRAADSRCRGACSEAAAHLPGKTGKFQGRCQGKDTPGQQKPAQVMHCCQHPLQSLKSTGITKVLVVGRRCCMLAGFCRPSRTVQRKGFSHRLQQCQCACRLRTGACGSSTCGVRSPWREELPLQHRVSSCPGAELNPVASFRMHMLC